MFYNVSFWFRGLFYLVLLINNASIHSQSLKMNYDSIKLLNWPSIYGDQGHSLYEKISVEDQEKGNSNLGTLDLPWLDTLKIDSSINLDLKFSAENLVSFFPEIDFEVDSMKIDRSLVESIELHKLYQLDGEHGKYQIIEDYYFHENSLIIISYEGTNYGYSGIRKCVVRAYKKIEKDKFQIVLKKNLGKIYYEYYSMDPNRWLRSAFADLSQCPTNMIKWISFTNIKFDIVSDTEVLIRYYSLRSYSESRKGEELCFEKYKEEELISMDQLMDFKVELDGFKSPMFYCECNQ